MKTCVVCRGLVRSPRLFMSSPPGVEIAGQRLVLCDQCGQADQALLHELVLAREAVAKQVPKLRLSFEEVFTGEGQT